MIKSNSQGKKGVGQHVHKKLRGIQALNDGDKEGKGKKKHEVRRTKPGGKGGFPRDSSFGCLCYQFAQKCQGTVKFYPAALHAVGQNERHIWVYTVYLY